MKRMLTSLLTLITAACSFNPFNAALPGMRSANSPNTVQIITPQPADEVYVSALPDYGPAPEFANEAWLNVESPLRLSALRGKVVLVDMWTFG